MFVLECSENLFLRFDMGMSRSWPRLPDIGGCGGQAGPANTRKFACKEKENVELGKNDQPSTEETTMIKNIKSLGLAAVVSALALPAFASEEVKIGVPS